VAATGGEQLPIKIEKVIGNNAYAKRNTHDLHFPVQRGVVVDPEDMEKMWVDIFEQELNADPKASNVLLTDAPLNSRENKIKLAEIMFESLGVNQLAIMNTAVLSLFSTGKTTGIVVECGEGVSYAVPIFEGYALPHAIQRLDVAG